jgi:hypothetical protein
MSTHPIFTERLDDEDWLDWYLRQQTTVTTNPPAAPEGFLLLTCEATPRHWPTYVLDDGEHDGLAYCKECSTEAYIAEHRTCEHDIKHRGAWRRWKATSKALSWLYGLGVVKGYGHSYGRGCNGCISGPVMWTWFHGPYVLFVSRETWRCWRNGHRRGEEIGFGFCGKCLPQPCCGNTGSGHNDDCDQNDVF